MVCTNYLSLSLVLARRVLNQLLSLFLFSFPDGLYDQKALQEYIIYAGQHPGGGLRDKPPKYVCFCFLLFD